MDRMTEAAAVRRPRFTAGQRLVAVYFALVYVAPLVGNAVLADHITSSYRIEPLTPIALVFLASTFALFLVFTTTNIRFLPALRVPQVARGLRAAGSVYMRVRLPVALGILALAVAYAGAGLNPYRYLDRGISDSGSALLLMGNVARVVATLDLLYSMFLDRSELPAFRSRRHVAGLAMAAALVTLADGTMSMILALVTLAFALNPRAFRRLTFWRGTWTMGRIRMASVCAVVVPLALFGAWVLGEIIKLTSNDAITLSAAADTTFTRIADGAEFFTFFAVYVVERLSIYYYSFLYTMAHSWADVNESSGWSIVLPLKTLLFRLDLATGGLFGVERPAVGSIMQLNYLSLTVDPINPRAGSAPGLLASFAYAFPFPLSVILCAMFAAFLSRVADAILTLPDGMTLSISGSLVFLAFVHTVLASPFDLLIGLDDSVISMMILFAVYKVRQNEVAARNATRGFRTAHSSARRGVDQG